MLETLNWLSLYYYPTHTCTSSSYVIGAGVHIMYTMESLLTDTPNKGHCILIISLQWTKLNPQILSPLSAIGIS